MSLLRKSESSYPPTVDRKQLYFLFDSLQTKSVLNLVQVWGVNVSVDRSLRQLKWFVSFQRPWSRECNLT